MRITHRARALLINALILLAGVWIGFNWTNGVEYIIACLLILIGTSFGGATLLSGKRTGLRDW